MTNGQIQTSYVYGPFGNTMEVAGTQAVGANDNPYRFGRRELEQPVGLISGSMYYSRGRYLDPGLSRFVSRVLRL